MWGKGMSKEKRRMRESEKEMSCISKGEGLMGRGWCGSSSSFTHSFAQTEGFVIKGLYCVDVLCLQNTYCVCISQKIVTI